MKGVDRTLTLLDDVAEIKKAEPSWTGSGSNITHLGVDGLLAASRRLLPGRVSPRELDEILTSSRDGAVLVVDIRPPQLRFRDGQLPGAIVVERNVLEWRLDPGSPDRLPQVTGYDQPMVLVCDEGYASSLAAASLQLLGCTAATDLAGGFQAWLAWSTHPSGSGNAFTEVPRLSVVGT